MNRVAPYPAFRDVLAYAPEALEVSPTEVRIPVTYHREWLDGFGARGWKLDVTIGDDEIIASTRETGGCIPTSVFVHDIFDHLLSGFAVSGHRAEAMALRQLGTRTGADILPDYAQMVREDLRSGRVVGRGDSFRAFAGETLLAVLDDPDADDRELAQRLCASLGEAGFEAALVERFRILGCKGDAHARRSWDALGLRWAARTRMALAVQQVFAQADEYVERRGVERVTAVVRVGQDACGIEIARGEAGVFTRRATVAHQRVETGCP